MPRSRHSLQEYADTTSLHGINYVFGSASVNYFERIVWSSLTVTSFIIALITIHSIFM